jgi:hypothetical protein
MDVAKIPIGRKPPDDTSSNSTIMEKVLPLDAIANYRFIEYEGRM